MTKENVVLFGASGTMGFEAFKELWTRKEKYNIILLLRPSKKNKDLFKKYEHMAHITPIDGKGVVKGDGLKIVWGDATNFKDVFEAIKGADWVLDAMAYISPMADYYPDTAKAVNIEGIRNIVKAIKEQPNGAEKIKLVYTGTVAETGDRLQNIHTGRIGDPLKPSIFDYYAVTKIAGERIVLESDIKHWASLRLTYIMPTNYRDFVDLIDPIMFHQPIDTFMENVTSRDAGYGLINCLDVPSNSDFWRKAYNMGGGPDMRCTAYDFMNRSYQINGLSGIEKCAERKWFALRNFHMQYYDDSSTLNDYLHYWRDSMDDWEHEIKKSMPLGMKLITFLIKKIPFIQKKIERMTYAILKDMAENHRNGTKYWYDHKNDMRITAFYKDYETYEAIPDWGVDMPQMHPEPSSTTLDHGYDESKKQLNLSDLKKAAKYRGGKCLSETWNKDMYETLEWSCAFGHTFNGKPYTILKTGHWCPICTQSSWNYDEESKKNPFFAQVWYPNHDKDENNFYPSDCIHDIAGADKDKTIKKRMI